MHPTQHPSSNDVLHPPVDATNVECRPLPVTRVFHDHPWNSGAGMHGVASLFSPGGTHAMKGEFAGAGDFEVLAFMVVLPTDAGRGPKNEHSDKDR